MTIIEAINRIACSVSVGYCMPFTPPLKEIELVALRHMRSVVEALECGVCRIIGRDRVVIPAILAIVIVDAGLQPVQIYLVVWSLDQQLRVIGSIVVVACEGDILAILVGVDDILLDGAVQLAEPTDLFEIGVAVGFQLIESARDEEAAKYGVGKESGKVKMAEQDNPYHGKSMYRNAEVYDYDFMVSLQPMEVHTMPSLASVKTGDRVDQKKAVSLGLKNAEEVGRVAENGSYAITNVYTGREIHLGQHGLEHSLGGNDVARLRTNARLSAIGGLIVQNAVPINGLTNKNRQANGTYALACLLKSGNRYVVAIVTVEEHSSTAVDIDYVDISHSISGRLVKNKEDSRSSTRETGYVLSEAPATTAFKVSIADFLEIVNETYRSILSADVLKHFGAERPADGYYSDRVLFSDRDTAPTFYSHMARVVDDVKQEKLGATSVVSMLRGKGVKAEEIKWSGIEAWLEGKKSVTKAELQEFIRGSMLQIEATLLDDATLSNGKLSMTKSDTRRLEEIDSQVSNIFDEVKSMWEETYGTEFPVTSPGNLVAAGIYSYTNAERARRLRVETDNLKEEARNILNRHNFFGHGDAAGVDNMLYAVVRFALSMPGVEDKTALSRKMHKYTEEFHNSRIANVITEKIAAVGYEGAGSAMILNFLIDSQTSMNSTLDMLSRKGVSFTKSELTAEPRRSGRTVLRLPEPAEAKRRCATRSKRSSVS